jgi:signal transduction histidine kinase
VVDDGVGAPTPPDEATVARAGGLDGLRDRVRSAGGSMHATSTGAGFRLVATVPAGTGVRP